MLNVNKLEATKILDSSVNVFLTGSAGSGKTYLVKEYVHFSKENIALTATTGIAALTMGGETIHRFLKLGIATRPEMAEKIINKWAKIKNSSKPWDVHTWRLMKNLDAIVIDEVSMLRRDQFELIDVVLSSIYDNPRPFGGMRMILVGDFFQLPPVVSSYDLTRFRDLREPYCFQSYLWKQGGLQSINLTTNYRQSEEHFLTALNKIRIGEIDKETDDLIYSCADKDFGDTNPIKFFPLKVDVARENLECLNTLGEEIYVSEAEYHGKDYDTEILKKECLAEHLLYYCRGAQIIMLTNDFEGRWVNGSLGIIEEVEPITIKLHNGRTVKPATNTWSRTEYKIGLGKRLITKVVAEMYQMPFRLGWSSSIHRSQGLTLKYIDLDLRKCFTYGQVYVALSRVKSLAGLKVCGWDSKIAKVSPEVKKFYGV